MYPKKLVGPATLPNPFWEFGEIGDVATRSEERYTYIISINKTWDLMKKQYVCNQQELGFKQENLRIETENSG